MNPQAYLDWLLGGAKPPDAADTLHWAVLQATDTFVWCVRDGDNWQRADQAPGSGVRPPLAERVYEARLFGPEAQLLFWKTDDGEWGHSVLAADPDNTISQTWLFAGSPQPLVGSSFTLRSDGAGRVTVTPPGNRLQVAQHLEEDTDTGLVRIVATRFVEILEK